MKVATIQFAPREGDVAGNRARMVDLARQAGEHGAKIIVLPEMATSGYSYFSRAEIAGAAETVPGTTTAALGAIADHYDAYIAFGMPQYVPSRNLYFNVAVLLGPNGEVVGTYRKRNNLLEASYNAKVAAPMPTFDTPYGRLAVVICSDMFYSQFPRAVAVQGATLLLAPANTGIDTDFVRLRTYENDLSMVVSNRYGSGTAGSKPTAFTQDTFTIPSPFAYDWSFGSRSIIMTNDGTVLANITASADTIGYGDVPVRTSRTFPVRRKPAMYSLIAQDTLEPYTQRQFRQPAATTFATAAVDPGPSVRPWDDALTAAQRAATDATTGGKTLRLIVFPADYFASNDPTGFSGLQRFSTDENIDLLIHYAATATTAPKSMLITPNGISYPYVRTHRAIGESIPDSELGNDYWVIDRDYARVALMQDVDMIPPETALVLAGMGVDVVAVNADSDNPVLSALWQSRIADYLHIAVANRQADEGIYLGGYQVFPSFREDSGEVIMNMNTADVRTKPTARFFDAGSLVRRCRAAAMNC